VTAKVKWKLTNQRDRLRRRYKALSAKSRSLRKQIAAVDVLIKR